MLPEILQIGSKIKAKRAERGWSTYDLAEKAFQRRERAADVTRWENGTLIPSLKNLVHLCRAFNCQLSDLLFVTSNSKE
ncbi:helix-turn-helix domain-containing protein [Deinococcus cellulosilyticus]|uniref:HTH cro/C1-type domain-containing protein n=1 Tax=Deinococcus cellulosilyticus (strain DSM 18568 / NBRC 106333 / KACC 11606 / 5516J-15) TaxID=1223518 RepID=A0A511MXK4_DEIC1|nr:helix-turn-helix transcriptional regulator [Deinococcus cellulosilyticus]GEM45332.1 hypothetical protein DC3_09670 [Deinococcus cellulosilyticus NBRC 106333 = KACC 11606]